MAEENLNRQIWHERANRLRSKVNWAWWLSHARFIFPLASVLAMLLVLLGRTFWSELGITAWLTVVFFVLSSAALMIWLRARPSFESLDDAIMRLDLQHHLKNSLIAAHQGMRSWPEAKLVDSIPLRWRSVGITPPFLLGLGIILLALWIPLDHTSIANQEISTPPLWERLAKNASALANHKDLAPEYPEKLKQELEKLKTQDAEDWFSHRSLEAAAQLAQKHGQQLDQLTDHLDKLSQALNQLQNQDLPPAKQQEIAAQLNGIMDQLENNQLQPNKELLDKLRQIGKDAPQNLDPEEMKALQDRLEKLQKDLRDAQADAGGQELEGNKPGNGDEQARGDAGRGGPGGGLELDDSLFKEETKPFALGKPEDLSSSDRQHIAPGDRLDVIDGQHQTPDEPFQLSSGGSDGSAGQGGQRMLKDTLVDPRERQLLQQYFEPK